MTAINSTCQRGLGSISIILYVLMVLPLLACLVSSAWLYVAVSKTRLAVDMAAKAAAKSVDEAELARGNIVLDGDAALNTFTWYLAENLQLTSTLEPGQGSIAAGRVTIEEFTIYGQADVPLKEVKTGVIIDRPAIHCVVAVPVELVIALPGLPSVITLRVHTDVGLNLTGE